MPTMKSPSRDQYSGDHLARLRRFKDKLDALGLTLPAFSTAFELAEHSRALTRQRSVNRAERSIRVREIAKALGRQEITQADALERAVEIQVEADPEGIWFDILKQGGHAAIIAAFEVLRDPDETLITGSIRPMIEQLLAEAKALRKSIPPEVSGPVTASRAGGKVAAAWSTYESLLERWNALHEFVSLARREGILPAPNGTADLRVALQPDRWVDLLAREDWLRLDPHPRVRVLLDADPCDLWGPGVFTAPEIEEHLETARRQVREEERVGVGVATR